MIIIITYIPLHHAIAYINMKKISLALALACFTSSSFGQNFAFLVHNCHDNSQLSASFALSVAYTSDTLEWLYPIEKEGCRSIAVHTGDVSMEEAADIAGSDPFSSFEYEAL